MLLPFSVKGNWKSIIQPVISLNASGKVIVARRKRMFFFTRT
jgi:hypothetical protein